MILPDDSLVGVRVVVVGLAREGKAITRFLIQHGATVTVTDAQPAEKLTAPLSDLENLGITFCLGGHPEHLLNPQQTDLLVVSPGVPLTIPFLQKAMALRIPLTTESRLFCQYCPAPIIGISGSSGKTTTTTLVKLMLQAAGLTTHIGGNIGQPLIGCLNQISPQDWVVMELSSFQLEYFHPNLNRQANLLPGLKFLAEGWSPQIGAILNITPNHLDRHKDMAAYTEAKRALVAYQKKDQLAVMGWDNIITRQIGQALTTPVHWFSLNDAIPQGAGIQGQTINFCQNDQLIPICETSQVKLRGKHNLYNILAACTIAKAVGVNQSAMMEVITAFTGVPHRLEIVTQVAGVTYINDSIATSPERLIAALNAFNEPIILLAGGQDKKLPWTDAARLIAKRVKHVILFGEAQSLIEQAVKIAKSPTDQIEIHLAHHLAQGVVQAKKLAQAGDIILLSPGGTSYDAYPDFAARGDHFRNVI